VRQATIANRGAGDERTQWVMKRVVGSVNKGECRTIVRQATIANRGAGDERTQWVMKRVVGSVNKGECRTIVRQATIANRGAEGELALVRILIFLLIILKNLNKFRKNDIF
jgi:hypothetical protein